VVLGGDLDPLPARRGAGRVLAFVGDVLLLGLEVLLEHRDLHLHARDDVGAQADLLAGGGRHQRVGPTTPGWPSPGTVPNTPRTSSEWTPRPALR
jgi:hypothetical protein